MSVKRVDLWSATNTCLVFTMEIMTLPLPFLQTRSEVGMERDEFSPREKYHQRCLYPTAWGKEFSTPCDIEVVKQYKDWDTFRAVSKVVYIMDNV